MQPEGAAGVAGGLWIVSAKVHGPAQHVSAGGACRLSKVSPFSGGSRMWCFSFFLLCLSVASHCCWGGLRSKMLSLYYLCQFFQILLENLSLLKKLFFSPMALICDCVCVCVCVGCVCTRTCVVCAHMCDSVSVCVCIHVEFWMYLKNVWVLRACAG